jgi:hypothetical protein
MLTSSDVYWNSHSLKIVSPLFMIYYLDFDCVLAVFSNAVVRYVPDMFHYNQKDIFH